jgi:hypothetical protein
LYFWLEGNIELADEYARLGLKEAEEAAMSEVHNAYVHFNMAEVTLRLWEQGISKYETYAQASLQRLKSYAKLYRIGQPRYLLMEGLFQWLNGQPSQAMKHWHAALKLAQEIGLPYDEAAVSQELARHLPQDDPQKAILERQAQKILTGLDVQLETIEAPVS